MTLESNGSHVSHMRVLLQLFIGNVCNEFCTGYMDRNAVDVVTLQHEPGRILYIYILSETETEIFMHPHFGPNPTNYKLSC